MQIEIAETLASSWLRHIKKCQVVQTNWKPANEWHKQNWEELERMKNEAVEFFSIEGDGDINAPIEESDGIFKKSANVSQIIRQTESDVIGICIGDGSDDTVYAVEVAFHMKGLDYSGKKTTKTKIIAKTIRTAMSIYCYLGQKKAELYFISPKADPATVEFMQGVQEEINLFFEEYGLEYKFKLLFNDDFYNEIWSPICNIVNECGVNDESELCMRAIGIHKLMSKYEDNTRKAHGYRRHADAERNRPDVLIDAQIFRDDKWAANNVMRIKHDVSTIVHKVIDKAIWLGCTNQTSVNVSEIIDNVPECQSYTIPSMRSKGYSSYGQYFRLAGRSKIVFEDLVWEKLLECGWAKER